MTVIRCLFGRWMVHSSSGNARERKVRALWEVSIPFTTTSEIGRQTKVILRRGDEMGKWKVDKKTHEE